MNTEMFPHLAPVNGMGKALGILNLLGSALEIAKSLCVHFLLTEESCSSFPHKATFRMKFNSQNPFSSCLVDAPFPCPCIMMKKKSFTIQREFPGWAVCCSPVAGAW